MELFAVLQQAGVDVETTLHRFCGNEALLSRFVKKFLEDITYPSLRQAMKTLDRGDIEISAHTLKGTAANLGFQRLSDCCNAVVQAVREGQGDNQLQQCFETASEEYRRIINLIAQID